MAFRNGELSRSLSENLQGRHLWFTAIEVVLLTGHRFIVTFNIKLLREVETGRELDLREALLTHGWS